MATASVTYTFTSGTTIASAEANTNFSDLVTFLNTDVIHKDASIAFTSIPSGPASNPSTDNQFSRKKYVDDQIAAAVLTRLKGGSGTDSQSAVHYNGPVAHGTDQLLVQAGSTTDTTSVNGRILVQYPDAFPTGIVSIFVCNGNADVGGGNIVAVDYDDSQSKTGFYATWRDDSGSLVTGASRRVNWIAVGW